MTSGLFFWWTVEYNSVGTRQKCLFFGVDHAKIRCVNEAELGVSYHIMVLSLDRFR